ncbi:deoxycytidylate deaminase [Moraxella osloensis]|nr:anti-phage dCTP deaminase [Moraxella osloensis]MBW4009286.1 deoxycytidylate deaminase [Moraxella osloensis]
MPFNDIQSKEQFLVIGLVGAVGSSLKTLSNVLKSIFNDDFNYSVEEISISKEFLENRLENKWSNPFERYTMLMDEGNKVRKEYSSEYLSYKVIEFIANSKLEHTSEKRKVYLVNSLKHDEEIKSLRAVYGRNFFQVSLYESPLKRKDVLINEVGMNEDEAKKIIKRDEGEENAYGQHTTAAFHLADYFIKFDNKSSTHMRNSCKRFISLLFGNPYITPTFNEFAMYMAFTSSLRSADLSRQVGAVLSKDRNIISTGCNDIPKFGGGQYWPEYNELTGEIFDLDEGRDYRVGEDSNQMERDKIVNEIFENIVSKFNFYFNEEDTLHKENKKNLKKIISESPLKFITEYGRVVHAEMDAILSCSRTNNSTIGTSMFVTTFPCHNCAKHIISSGIKEVFFIEPYPKSKALKLWKDSITIDNQENKLSFKPFVGVGPKSFLDLFSMSQGDGNKIIRKQSGKTVEWKSKTSTLRLGQNVYSVKEIERNVIEKLKSFES